eukprot:COSAG04_NODE_563_length_12569_cov_28.278655_1_plen_236_part_00
MAQRGLGQFFGSPQPGRWAPAAAAPPERQEEQGPSDGQEGSGNDKTKEQRRLGSFFETKAGAWSPPDKGLAAEEPTAAARSPPAAPIPLPSDVLDRMATVRSSQPRASCGSRPCPEPNNRGSLALSVLASVQLLFDEFEAALKEARAAAQPRPRPDLLRTPAIGDLVQLGEGHTDTGVLAGGKRGRLLATHATAAAAALRLRLRLLTRPLPRQLLRNLFVGHHRRHHHLARRCSR